MIKVIKTDLFRLFRTKAFYAFPIVMIVFMTVELLFSASMETATESYQDENGVYYEVETSSVTEYSGDTEETKYTRFGAKDLFDSVSDGLMLLFVGIALIIFATNETRCGFVKTAAGCVNDRGNMPLSKVVLGMFVTLVYMIEFAVIKMIFTVISSLATGRALKYEPLPDGDAGRYAIYLMLGILVHFAIMALAMLFHESTHSRAWGIVIIFLISTGNYNLVIMLFDFIKEALGILEDFDIGKYLLMRNLAGGYTGADYHPMVVFVMSMIYLVGGTAAAMWVSKRKDIS